MLGFLMRYIYLLYVTCRIRYNNIIRGRRRRMERMTTARQLKIATGIFEAFLGIPILGGIFIVLLWWTPLLIMFFLHVVTLIFTIKEKDGFTIGSIIGMITSCIAWIPFLGMIMHILTAVCLITTAVYSNYDRDDDTIMM